MTIKMENLPSIPNYCRRVSTWLRDHVPTTQSRVSHTKVQVLSSTHNVPPPGPKFCRPCPQRLCGTWAKRTESGTLLMEYCLKKSTEEDTQQMDLNKNPLVSNTSRAGVQIWDAAPLDHTGRPVGSVTKKSDKINGNSSRCNQERRSAVADDDDDGPAPCCLCIPVLPLRRWRRRRRAKVSPLHPSTPSNNPLRKPSKDGGQTRVAPMTTEVSVVDLEDEDIQEVPTDGVSTQQMAKRELNGPPKKAENILHLTEEDCKLENISPESILPPRPKTSRGFRHDIGGGEPPSWIQREEKSSSEVITWTRDEDKVVGNELVDEKPDLLGLELMKENGSGEDLNVWRNQDDDDDDDYDSEDDNAENDTWAQIEEAVSSGQTSVASDSECQQEVTPRASKHSVKAGGETKTSEEEIQYELKQREQWQLAAVGEWSIICQDDGEDEYETECYLRGNEFQKEESIRNDWKAIVEQYRSVGVIQDLLTMQTLSKCAINQCERALRQFARICRGPVPLSESGQTKSEALASLSLKVEQQTKRISEDISGTFMEFYHIFEELDILRDRQDRVEESLLNDLRRKDEELARRSSSSRSLQTPRTISRRLHQWEIDMDLIDIYTNGAKVKSESLITVLPTIHEDQVLDIIAEEDEYQDSDDSGSEFPEYNGMDDAGSDDDDINIDDVEEKKLEEATKDNEIEDAAPMGGLEDEQDKKGDGEEVEGDEKDEEDRKRSTG